MIKRKRRSLSRQLRAAALSRQRRQHETVTTEDILRLAKNSRMYSPLLNNYTLPVNASDGNGSSNMHEHQYEAAVVYGKTELTITNLRHFQEYSIEVSVHRVPQKKQYLVLSINCFFFCQSVTDFQNFFSLKELGEKICYISVIKLLIAPKSCCYTTL